jgi:hypothetical protein
MREFARIQGDAVSEQEAVGMIALAKDSIQQHFWNASAPTPAPPAPTPPPPPLPSGFIQLSPYDWTSGTDLTDGTRNILASEAACVSQCAALVKCEVGLYLSGTVRHGECWLATAVDSAPRRDFCEVAGKPGQACLGFAKNSSLGGGSTGALGSAAARAVGGAAPAFYAGDTTGSTILMETASRSHLAFHSNDGLHGQVQINTAARSLHPGALHAPRHGECVAQMCH